MKKIRIIVPAAAALLLALVLFWDPILDFLPIDQSRWVEQDGNRYLLDEDGDPRIGWVTLENGTFYFREDGVMHTGWLQATDGLYYFLENGEMVTLWQELDGASRYFGTDGKLASGLLEDGNTRFYFDSSGVPQEGFYSAGENVCYIFKDGQIRDGWVEQEDDRYHLNQSGFVDYGWLTEGGNTYYLDPVDGRMVTGWLDEAEYRCYLNEADGTLATGWAEIDGTTYYFDESGWMQRGWIEIDGNKYYLEETGALYTGWLEYEGHKYYLREDGRCAVGKLEIDGQNYFFSSTGKNFIMVNPWNSLPEGFEAELVTGSGTWLDPVCKESLAQMLADCRAAGYSPKVRSGYRSVSDQKVILRNKIKTLTSQGYSYDDAYAVAVRSVAVPGTSEHHLGLAFDIVDTEYPHLTEAQAERPTQKWLMENCWKYGFILRYPVGSTDVTGIIYEPWHYRYVGVELAMELYELGGIPLETYIDNLTNDGTTCGGKLVIIE